MCMAIKLQGWSDGVTDNHAWAIVKRGSFPAAILKKRAYALPILFRVSRIVIYLIYTKQQLHVLQKL